MSQCHVVVKCVYSFSCRVDVELMLASNACRFLSSLGSGRSALGALLGEHLAGIELHQHSSIRLQLRDRNRESEVVQQQELQLQVIQFRQWQTTNLYAVNMMVMVDL